MSERVIRVRGAREHNLKNVSLELPHDRLICFTGVSGSGKSSLAFDTLYAEGQRRYVESLSAYARQFLGQLAKPDVDQITGLRPAIAIQQKSTGWNPRSTVGTVTGIYDFLRVLYARAGRQHCPKCGKPISAQTLDAIVARVLGMPAGSAVLILAPVVRGQKGEHVDLLDDLRRRGYVRARIDGQVVHLRDAPKLGRNNRHDIEVVIDRLTLREGVRSRLTEALEAALGLGDGTVIVAPAEKGANEEGAGREANEVERRSSGGRGGATAQDLVLSSKYACVACGIGFDPPSPQLFSFNSPSGMCLNCDGMGTTYEFDPVLLVPDPSQPFLTPCVAPMRTRPGKWRKHIFQGVARHVGFDLALPWKELPAKARQALLYGTGDAHITFEWKSFGRVWKHGGTFEGVIAELKTKYRAAKAEFVRQYYEQFMRHGRCEECGGARLNAQARAVKVGGRPLSDLCSMSIRAARQFVDGLELSATETLIAAEVLKEVRGRLQFLADVGLDYLTLDRTAPTLSGGESQRIRLASQIGCGLVGVLYVLDEPSIGLHPRDNRKLLASLQRLRDMGNTVVVVEHDEETMRAADLVVDFGPGPGVRGGHVVSSGKLEDLKRDEKSLTGQYLAGTRKIEVPAKRRAVERLSGVARDAVKAPRTKSKTSKRS